MTDQELWESDPDLWRAADKARKKWMWETPNEGDTAHHKAQIAFRAGFALGVKSVTEGEKVYKFTDDRRK